MESNKKGSDKNVGSMEEDIKLVESLIKEFEVYGDLDAFEDVRPYMKAINHLIKAYKELKDEIDILMGQNEWYKDGKTQYYCYGYIDNRTDELIEECKECSRHVYKAQDDLDRYLLEKVSD